MAIDTDTVDDSSYTETVLEGEEKDEELDDSEVIYQINTSGADFDVDGLVKRFEKGVIFRPDFQRNFVWTWPQASKFIESILLGLPIPSVFLYREEESQKLLIVDGLQRLTTLHAFKKGRLPNNNRVFRLKDVKKRFNGKTLDELEPDDQRRFEDSLIHAMIIQQSSPDNNNGSVYHIFERLNSSGTPLQPQEIRAAAFHGAFQETLDSLNKDQNWRSIFGAVHKRAKDQELILRFLALKYDGKNYRRPMKGFLNDFMKKHRHNGDLLQGDYSTCFRETIKRAHDALGSPAFVVSRSMNVAFFDSFMVAIANNPNASAENIRDAAAKLTSDGEFIKLVSESTANESSVVGRMQRAQVVLDAISVSS